MANAVYPKAKETMLSALIDGATLAGGTLKAALVDLDDYTYSAAHEFYDDVSAAVIGTPQEVANATFVNGLLDGDNITFSAVTGDEFEALVFYIDTGTPSTSPLLAYFDTSVTGLPLTPNGGDILGTWNGSGILQF